ncbi:Unconventional myosin-VI [Bonamia ostreae]|uniref:Unconventional myosin-VI n=1 Tax=Bonamia ostreae TaxID=126728 RepID=A0ABV2AJG3_9EUKA
MEWAKGGDLYSLVYNRLQDSKNGKARVTNPEHPHIKSRFEPQWLSESEILRVVLEISEALNSIHSAGYIHRDIKV